MLKINIRSFLLLLEEAGLENDTAAFYLAIHFFRIISQTDALYFSTSFDDH